MSSITLICHVLILCMSFNHRLAFGVRNQTVDDCIPIRCDAINENALVRLTVNPLMQNKPPIHFNSAYVPHLTVGLMLRNIQIMSNGTFTFASKHYVPLGQFVTSINGIQAGSNEYWELLVNGRHSDCGVDTTILRANDSVMFKLTSNPPIVNDEDR